MALTKTPLDISFAAGLDTKTDPFRVSPGKFLSLENSVFGKAGSLTKRNGFKTLAALPSTSGRFLTTFNGNLTAIGSDLSAFSATSSSWVVKSDLTPVSLEVLPLIRSNTNQSYADSVVAPSGLVCTVYTDNIPSGGSNVAVQKYVVADSTTGQNIVAPTVIPSQGGGTVRGSPKVFLLGSYFLIVYTNTISATAHLNYIALSTTNPTTTPILGEITSSYVPAATVSWDGIVYSNTLYIGYNTLTGGQRVAFRTITSSLVIGAATSFSGEIATTMSLFVDYTNPTIPIIWASYYNLSTTTGKVLALASNLGTVLAPTTIISSGTYANITCCAHDGHAVVFAEKTNSYAYNSSLPSNYIEKYTITQAGAVTTPSSALVRSVGLASEAFHYNDLCYFLGVYNSSAQPTYFLIDENGNTISKLAYSNAGPYYTTGLPSAVISNGIVNIAYLYKDQIQAVNKAQNVTSSSGVYAQLGINLVSFNLASSNITTAEIGKNLNISGGYISAYDGYQSVENGFFLYPDDVTLNLANGGSMPVQQYFYQVTYEWSDNQGNLFRSAPSIPVSITTSSGNQSVNLYIPTLRITHKTNNPVKIVIYRWSAAQQVYYQVTSILTPTLNDLTVDYIHYVDTLADSAIIGNSILYTTGGVLENIAPPASDVVTLFNNRLFMVDSEDKNLLWYSKQVIEATPVEMSDLLTIYVAPTTASEGSTGPITAIAPMDDKLIVFKENALGYISGVGPDNTGANSQYSDFILITSVVGCTNPQSIVFTPQGLMFSSNKGIWILGRDLSTNYIGAPVEKLTTDATVLSSLNIPATNQIRFTLDSGITLMYDYYFGQWGTFTNIPAVSSTIYQGLHTYLSSHGLVCQETPGLYLDNTTPVLMSFTTGWMSLSGVQGYERFYQAFLLGTYITPFKLNVSFSYDFNSSKQQSTIVTPLAPSLAYGSDALWGSDQLNGGNSKVFEARIFPTIQKCESFQVSVSEMYDPSYGIAAGEGLILSGMNLLVGLKKVSRVQSSSRSFG